MDNYNNMRGERCRSERKPVILYITGRITVPVLSPVTQVRSNSTTHLITKLFNYRESHKSDKTEFR